MLEEPDTAKTSASARQPLPVRPDFRMGCLSPWRKQALINWPISAGEMAAHPQRSTSGLFWNPAAPGEAGPRSYASGTFQRDSSWGAPTSGRRGAP